MTERELIYVKTIADEGSISKAAQKLYLSQPSLSHCVQRIEESLGAKLFTRSPTGLTLTYVGERYYSVATEILHIYSDFQQEVGEMKSLRSGRITVGMATYLATWLLPQILPEFHRKFPHVSIALEEKSSTELEAGLASRHLDFAVMHSFANSTQQEKSSIAFYPISRSPFVLAAPVGSGLDRYACPDPESPYPVLDLAHVKDWPFVLVSPGRRIRQISDHILWQAGITPQVVLTTVSYETAHRLACRGLGLTFIPLQYKEIFQGPYPGEYYSIDAACSPYWDLCVAVARDSYISNAAQVFIHLLNDYFGNRMEWPGQ
ncbi:MAG: LysR family transcriptional regulator [Angelakisella sp.]|jgi:DNA-binding transcriptional LysR family regulator|nr:LysR family transcriptional regulator [Angelakisella sp.]